MKKYLTITTLFIILSITSCEYTDDTKICCEVINAGTGDLIDYIITEASSCKDNIPYYYADPAKFNKCEVE